MDEVRFPRTALLAGLGVAAVGLILAGATDGPYLTSDDVNWWIVVFAAGLFAGLFALPFAIERRLRPRVEDEEKRWERALLLWGGASAAVLAFGVIAGSSAGWSGSELAGAAGLIVTIEAGLVLATMVVWLVSD
jgi:peptidoglycan/LPS O-acetylase OafA/YrhL